MSHFTQAHMGQASFSSFSITQSALGSPLEFEPALGSQELDNLINDYIHGLATTQQKRARVVLEFLNSIDINAYQHPVCLHYYVPTKIEPASLSKPTNSLKRARDESVIESPSGAKRLPGFSILTRDGVDITEYASRGPKTKEQRDHAALMRRLKACAACKRSKQRCDPSHHIPTQSALGTPSSAASSARHTSFSSSPGSRGSISPPSSLGESFSQSPGQSFASSAFVHAGMGFSSLSNSNMDFSPADLTLSDPSFADATLLASLTENIDSVLFEHIDGEVDSSQSYLSQYSSTSSHISWSNQDDLFTPIYGTEPRANPGFGHMRQNPLNELSSHVTHEEIPGQNHDPQSVLCQTIVSHGLLDSEFDLDDWLYPNLDNTDNERPQSRHRRQRGEQRHGEAHRTTISQSCDSCQYQDLKCMHALPLHATLEENIHSPPAFLQVVPRPEVGGSLANPQPQESQSLGSRHNQDYVLYPDSEYFNMDLEAGQIFRDVASTRWPPTSSHLTSASEMQNDALLLPYQDSSLQPVLNRRVKVQAHDINQTPERLSLSQPDHAELSSRNDKSLLHECSYKIVSGDGSLLDMNDRISNAVIVNDQNSSLGVNGQIPWTYITRVNDQIPSDSQRIPRVNDQITDIDLIPQNVENHTQTMLSNCSSTSIQGNHSNISRRSQEDDGASIQRSSASDNYCNATLLVRIQQESLDVPVDLLVAQANRTSTVVDDEYPTSQGSLSLQSLRSVRPEDLSRSLQWSPFVVEGESEHMIGLNARQELLEPLTLGLPLPGELEQYIEPRAHRRLRKMYLFVSLCAMMTIAILATISLLLAGSDHTIDSISGAFLQDTVTLYNDLPKSQLPVVYGASECITTELDSWNISEPASQAETDNASWTSVARAWYLSELKSQVFVEAQHFIPDTGLAVFPIDLSYDDKSGSMEDSLKGCHGNLRIYGTPTSTTINPTTMPTISSTPIVRAVEAVQANSKAPMQRRGSPSLLRKASFQRHSMNRENILGDITLRMTSLRIG